MLEVVGISFKHNSKIYYFSPNNNKLSKGTKVIVNTERGLQFGNVELENFKIDSSKIKSSLSKVIRVATKKDEEKHLKNVEEAKKAFDRSQLLFTFLSDNRVDFRKLAKDLANIYKTRIELRQVGVRDKAKEVGGFGSCGRELCCSRFLCDLDSVSINMAKTQNIALNPTKINGVCGRLLCCLKYENECYREYSKTLPKVGKKVETKDGEGKVISVDILNQTYRVELKDGQIVEVDKHESN